MKIEPKDVKEYLSIKGKIVVTGKSWSSLAHKFLVKFKHGYKKRLDAIKEKTVQAKESVVNAAVTAKDKVVSTTTDTVSNIKDKILPSEEVIQAKKEEKIEQIDTKRYELDRLKSSMEQEDEYIIGENKYYLKEVKNELKKLDKKKMKVVNKGLSIFSLTKLTLSNIKKNIKNKWAKHLENKNEAKRQNEIEIAKERLRENFNRLKELKEEENNILETYPELNESEEIHTITKIDDGKETEITESYIKVTEIKNPSKEEKIGIKNSEKFKKALATMAIITGIAISGYALSNTPGTQVDLNNGDLSNDSIVQSETELEESNNDNLNIIEEKENTLKLGNYLTIENGSTIYQTPELTGNHGVIGNNGYNDETLFKVNAITYVDENNNEMSFNLVQKNEQSQKLTMEKYKKFIEQNANAKVKNFHITPCDELGIPIDTTELGGWTNIENAKFENVDTKQVTMEAYQSLGGRVL